MDLSKAWRKLAANFGNLAQNIDGAKLYASWEPFGWNPTRWTLSGTTNSNVKERYLAFAERAGVLIGGGPGSEAVDRWFEELRGSSRIEEMIHCRKNPNGTEDEASGEIIRSVCLASGELCYRMETQTIAGQHFKKPAVVEGIKALGPPKDVLVPVPGKLKYFAPETREARLQEFMKANGASVAAVSRAAGVFKANMQQWRRGELSDASVMSQRIEDVLRGKRPLG